MLWWRVVVTSEAMISSYTPMRGEALFHLDGDLLVPGVLCRGPWYEGSLHGSAMLAAVARAAEHHHTSVPRQVVRLTVDMMRAAPMAPLRVETSTVRSGKSIDFVDIALYANDELWVRGTALRIRVADLEVDTNEVPRRHPKPPTVEHPGAPPLVRPGADEPAFHHAIDIHADPAAQIVWFRLAVPVVEGEPNSGFLTTATLADWTYSVPSLLLHSAKEGSSIDEERSVFAINADTTINTFRPLSGPWLGMSTTSHTGSLGAGTANAELYDQAGPLGFSSQSILVRGPSGGPLAVREVSG